MNKLIFALASTLLIDKATEFTDEDALLTAIQSSVSKLKADADKFTEVSTELDTMKKDRVNGLVERAITEGRITPAEKQNFTDLAQQNFTLAETTISKLPVSPEFAKSSNAAAGSDITPQNNTSKFFKEDGKKISYKDILDDAKLAKNFTDDELTQLRKESGFLPG